MTQRTSVGHTGNTGTATFQGFAQEFEVRPEPLYSRVVHLVVDAEILRKRLVGELYVFHIPHLFTGGNEVFLGFGKPNTYLVVPDGSQPAEKRGKPVYGYQKFAGKSLKRAPSVVEDTRNWVQAGMHVRFLGLPDGAAPAIRSAMARHHGIKYWTCVNACLRVLEDAGFTFGPSSRKKLSSIYFPYQLFRNLLDHGLYFNGQPVNFEFIRTADMHLERYMTDVVKAELLTFCRHADRAIDGKAEAGSKVWKGIRWARNLPARVWSRLRKPKEDPDKQSGPIAPLLPEGVAYCNDIRVRVSKPSQLGLLLRLFWGQHTLFELSQDRIDVNEYLPDSLAPFPQKNPNLATRLKKWVLFNKFVIRFILGHLAPRWEDLGTFDERTVHAMLRTDSAEAPNRYNVVITRKKKIVIARIASGSKLASWILSKHVLLANWDSDLPWAGEGGKQVTSEIEVDGNSGTYQPSDAQTVSAGKFVKAVLPHCRVTAKLRSGERVNIE